MGLSVTQVTLSLGVSLFENIFDIILSNYLYSFSAKTEQEDSRRGQGWGFSRTPGCGIPEEEPFPVVYNFKVLRRFAHPRSLSSSLSSLSSDKLSSRCRLWHPWSSDAPCCWLRAFWPAAAITHFPGCWSLIPGFPCPYVICASSFFSHYVSLLCYLSDCLYFLIIFLYHLCLIPHVLCFSIFLSTYFLNFTFWSCSLHLSVYAPAHISEFLGSCILVCLTGSVSVAYLHPLIVGAFSFTRKHTKCSSDHLKEVVRITEQLVWVSLCIESSSEKEISSIRFQKVRFLLQCLPPACFVRLSKLFTFSEL